MDSAATDAMWMRQALALAAGGEGAVEPNPMVGCVLIDPSHPTGPPLGTGFHQRFGEAHAERMALADARSQGNGPRLRGATAYVTLEPCCHYGKTPPCTEALIEAGIARVVVAQPDPFPQVSGGGLSKLRSAGIQVDVGIEQLAAQRLNAPYLKRLQRQRPWVIAKWAMSLDGKLASRSGDSQWISGEESRAEVQRLRARVDAILVGSRTAQLDNPRLTARAAQPPLRTAWRVVVDSRLQLPDTSHLITTARETPVLLACGPQASAGRVNQLRELGCHILQSPAEDQSQRLDELLHTLARDFAATNVLVEGGGQLLGSLFDLQQIDQCEVFIAPKLIGGALATGPLGGIGVDRLSDGPTTHSHRVQTCGDDVHFSLRLSWPTDPALGPTAADLSH